MRTAVYVRVSTDEQVSEGYSISAQRERLQAYCQSQGWTVKEAYVEEGKSAKDLDRPELQRLITDAEAGLFDVVLVYKLDRLTRSVLDLYTLLQTFERHNIKFKSATELYDTTTAMGKLFITLVAALAQWERENLAERVRVGMEQMVSEGKRPGGPIPYGYNKELKAIPEEKRILRELRRLYMEERLGFYSIAKTLNSRGMKRRGEVDWSSFTVYSVLDNPFYAGKLRWGSKNSEGKYVNRKLEDNVEFLIAESDHDKIFTWEEYLEHRERMASRQFKGYSKKREYWFAGVLRCAKCGSAMTGRVKKNATRKDGVAPLIIAYICSNKQLRGTCKMPIMRQELVESLVLSKVSDIKLSKERMLEQAKEYMQYSTEVTESNELELETLNKQLTKVKERKRKWQIALIDGALTREEYQERISEERENEESIQARLSELRSHITDNTDRESNEYDEVFYSWEDYWRNADDSEKNDMIRSTFRYIEIDTPLESAYGLSRKGKFLPASISDYKLIGQK